MDMKIKLKINLGTFSKDISFEKELIKMIEHLMLNFTERISYKFENKNSTGEISIESDVDFIKTYILKSYMDLTSNKELNIQNFLKKDIRFIYKLDTSLVNYREGDFEDLVFYINLIS